MDGAVGVGLTVGGQSGQDTDEVGALLLTVGDALDVLGLHLGVDQGVVGGVGILGGDLVDGVAGLPAAADDKVIILSHQSAHIVLERGAVGALGHGGLEAVLGGGLVQSVHHLGQEHLGAHLVAHQSDLHALAGQGVAAGFAALRGSRGGGLFLLGAAGRHEGHGQHQGQEQCKSLFHVFSSNFYSFWNVGKAEIHRRLPRGERRR